MDARERLNESLDVIGDGQFVSVDQTAAVSTLAGALALQSIAASLIEITRALTPSDGSGIITPRQAVLSNESDEPQAESLPAPSVPSTAMAHGDPALTDAQGEET